VVAIGDKIEDTALVAFVRMSKPLSLKAVYS